MGDFVYHPSVPPSISLLMPFLLGLLCLLFSPSSLFLPSLLLLLSFLFFVSLGTN